jgi:outer membrane protein
MKILTVAAAIGFGAAAWAQSPQQLTLDDAEAMALKNHPAIAAAKYTADAASQKPTQAAAVRYPTVYGSFTGAGAPENSRIAAGGLNNPVIYSRFATGVSVNQLLFDFGRSSHQVASSRSLASAQQQNYEATRNSVLLDVDRAYFEALRAKAVVTVAEQTVQARQLVVDQVTELQKAQLKSGLDLSFATVALEEANLLLVSSRNQLEAAQANLTDALGSSSADQFELVEQPFKVEPLILSDLEDQALANRPDLKARRFERDGASEQAAAEKALSYPQVSAMASAGWLPAHASSLPTGFSAAGLNVNLPFLNGGLYKSRRTEAELETRAAEERTQALENDIARDVKVAWLNVNNAADRVNLSQRLVDQANQALDLAQERYQLGLSSIVELSQAQLAQTSAQIEYTNAKYDYQLQRAVLNYQVGR